MRAGNTATAWGWVARAFHWLTVGLIVWQLGLALYVGSVDDLAARFAAAQVHKSWGAVILAVTLARLGWRLGSRRVPHAPAGASRGAARLAAATHVALYALLLVLPVAGWVYASASPLQALMEVENRVFDLFALPDPWDPGNQALADAAYVVHRGAALALAALVALHAAAALRHHFVLGDDVLARMTWSR